MTTSDTKRYKCPACGEDFPHKDDVLQCAFLALLNATDDYCELLYEEDMRDRQRHPEWYEDECQARGPS